MHILSYGVEISKKRRKNANKRPKNPEKLNDALCLAVFNGNEEAVYRLLKNGADPNNTDENGFNTLHYAIRKGCFWIIQLLIDHGADIEHKGKRGLRPIHMIAYGKNEKQCLEELMKNNVQLNSIDNNRNSLLHFCVMQRPQNIEFIKTLIQYGMDPNQVNIEGCNCLHILASSKKDENQETIDLASLLIKMGTQINLQVFEREETALQLATRKEKSLLVDLLLTKGADINIKNYRGKTAFDLMNDTDTPPISLIFVFVKHIILKIHRNENIDETISEIINSDRAFQIYRQQFEDHLHDLKQKRINNDYAVTYYDILCGGRYNVAKYLRNKNILDNFYIWDMGSYVYAPDIAIKFQQGLDILNLLDRSLSTVYHILGNELPYSCVEVISKYFTIFNEK